MKVLAIISARGGSKGVPRKNIRKFGDIPLIAHMFLKAKKCPEINKIVCSTDDSEIATVARDYGVDVPFQRPKELSGDRVPLITTTKHAMSAMDELGYKADIIVQLSPTCPFVKIESISKSIQYVSQEDCDCAVSLQKIEHDHPYRARRMLKNNYQWFDCFCFIMFLFLGMGTDLKMCLSVHRAAFKQPGDSDLAFKEFLTVSKKQCNK